MQGAGPQPSCRRENGDKAELLDSEHPRVTCTHYAILQVARIALSQKLHARKMQCLQFAIPQELQPVIIDSAFVGREQ